MLKIPMCLRCKRLLRNGTMRCEAFPNGMPKNVLPERKEEGFICNNGIGFVKQIEEKGESAWR